MIQEITDEQAEEINSKQNEIKESEKKVGETAEDIEKKLKTPGEQINLLDIDEGKNEVRKEDEGTRRLLQGFKNANVKIHLLSEDIDKLFTKSKFRNLFDAAALSIHSANHIDKEGYNNLFKNGSHVHIETSDYLCVLKKEQKSEFRDKIAAKCQKAGWKQSSAMPYKHHVLYEVHKEESAQEEASTCDESLKLDFE